MNKWLQLVLLSLVLVATVQCSDEGDGTITLSINPSSPFTYTSEATVQGCDGTDETLSPNWTFFSMDITNNSTEKSVQLVSFEVEVSALSGTKESSRFSFNYNNVENDGAITIEKESVEASECFAYIDGLSVDEDGSKDIAPTYTITVIVKGFTLEGTVPDSPVIGRTTFTTSSSD